MGQSGHKHFDLDLPFEVAWPSSQLRLMLWAEAGRSILRDFRKWSSKCLFSYHIVFHIVLPIFTRSTFYPNNEDSVTTRSEHGNRQDHSLYQLSFLFSWVLYFSKSLCSWLMFIARGSVEAKPVLLSRSQEKEKDRLKCAKGKNNLGRNFQKPKWNLYFWGGGKKGRIGRDPFGTEKSK